MTKPPTDALRVALYARISLDKAGTELGVERQISALRKQAADAGWRVVEEIVDNDVSAYSGAKRPGYRRLLDLIEADAIDVVAVWQLSRLWRNRIERSVDMEIFREHQINVVTASGPSFDFSTASGRFLSDLLSALDVAESAIKSERVAAATEQRVASGRPSGTLGYGWRRKTDGSYRLEASEAKIVREIVRRVGAGETLRGITDDLNRRGIPAPGATYAKPKRGMLNPDGSLWAHTSVRKLASRESNRSKIVHRGEIVGDGIWPAIVTEEEHLAALDALASIRSRKAGNRTGESVRKHLLSRTPVAVCGVCGGPLRAKVQKGRYGVPQALYICQEGGHAGRREDRVDAFVEAVAIDRLSRPDLADLLDLEPASRAGTAIELERLRGRLEDVEEQIAAGKIAPASGGRITLRLEREIADLEAAERRSSVETAGIGTALAPFVGSRDPRAVWEGLDVSGRLAVLESLGMRIRILQRTKTGPGFEPETIEIRWVDPVTGEPVEEPKRGRKASR